MITLHLVTEYVTFCRVRFKVLSISTIFDTLKPLNHHGIIMHDYDNDPTVVTRFAFFPKKIEGTWIWWKTYEVDYVLVHGRSDGCSSDIYELQNPRLIISDKVD